MSSQSHTAYVCPVQRSVRNLLTQKWYLYRNTGTLPYRYRTAIAVAAVRLIKYVKCCDSQVPEGHTAFQPTPLNSQHNRRAGLTILMQESPGAETSAQKADAQQAPARTRISPHDGGDKSLDLDLDLDL